MPSKLATELRDLLRSGVHRIGELEIRNDVSEGRFAICHWEDVEMSREPSFGGLEVHNDPGMARALSIYAADGSYRFTKGRTDLKRGWIMLLAHEEDLRQALDHFYPAGVGVFLAYRSGSLEIENLRDKLNRQTGMYRFAKNISDAGAQRLVREVCGPGHMCVKRVLWQLDAATPLEDSEASRFNGIHGDLPENEAIPLLCREACNHFVNECRQVSKAEAAAKAG